MFKCNKYVHGIPMFVCVCVCVCICMYIYIKYVHTCVFVCIYICIHTCIHTYIHASDVLKTWSARLRPRPRCTKPQDSRSRPRPKSQYLLETETEIRALRSRPRLHARKQQTITHNTVLAVIYKAYYTALYCGISYVLYLYYFYTPLIIG